MVLGRVRQNEGKNEQAIKSYERAIQIADQANRNDVKARAYQYLGYVYNKTCNFDAAIKSYLKVNEISHDLGEKEEEANACLMLGDIFRELKQHEQAIEFFRKAINVSKELENTDIQTKAVQGLGTLYLTLASVFSKDCDYKVAIDWYNKALALFGTEFRYHLLQEKTLTGLAVACFNLGDTEKAIGFIQDAQKIVKKETDTGKYFT